MNSSKPNSTLRVALGLALLSALLLAVPATAGTVYVVLASDTTEDGFEMDTELIVANSTAEPIEVSMHFIPLGSDGTERPEGFEPFKAIVEPRRTDIFTNLTDGGGRGLLEVSASSTVGISARMVSRKDGVTHTTEVPVIGSRRLLPAGQFHILNGWIRDETKRTSFGLVNLSHAPNSCLVQAVAPSGGALVNVTSLAVPPLSSMYFSDAMMATGTAEGEDVRLQIVCSGDAYSYSMVRDIETGVINTLRPAADGGSLLRAPGAPLVCEDDWFCIERQGVFLIPTPGNPLVKIDFDAPRSSYSSFSLKMTVTHGGWNSRNEAGLHSLAWVVPVGDNGRTEWKRTPIYANLRGGNKNILVNNSILDGVRPTAPIPFGPGKTFVVEIFYDAANRNSTTRLLDLDGGVLAEVAHGTSARVFDTSDTVRVEIGLDNAPADSGYPEIASYGWIYQDLEIQMVP